MKNAYEDHKEEYFETLPCVPLKGKRPFTSDWLNHVFTDDEIFNNCNIGLKTGAISGVICVDIDVTDDNEKQEIYKQLPPLFSGKTGNKKKGINYFFKYNGETSRAFKGIDILSNGKQTVLPPSMHDNGYEYAWQGSTLLDIDIDDLPDLPNSFIKWCEKRYSTTVSNQIIQSNGERCNHGSHNILSAQLVAKIADQKKLETITTELLEADAEMNLDISYFQCPSRTWKVSNKNINVNKFINEGLENWIAKGNSYNPSDTKITFNLKDTKQAEARKKFPRLRGISQVMFEEVYKSSTKQRSRFAVCSVLSTMSVLLGNKIKIGTIHPNLYSLIIAASGEGKDVPLKYPNRVLAASGLTQFIGQSNPASDTGILMGLTDENSKRLDTIDEADMLFSTINAPNSAYGSKIADVYASLYTSCGSYFTGKLTAANKGKKVGECHNPYISIIAAMTPKAFMQSFTTSIIEKGLGARFLYFIDENPKRNALSFKSYPIDARITDFAKQWNAETPQLNFSKEIPEMQITREAKDALHICNDAIEDMKFKIKEHDKMKPIYNRMYVNLVKIAMIDACSTHYPNKGLPVLTIDSVNWAKEFMLVYHQNMKNFIDVNVSENGNEYLRNIVIRPLSKEEKGMTGTELYNATRSMSGVQRKIILAELIEHKQVYKIETSNTGGRKSTLYVHHRYVTSDNEN